MKDAAPYTSLDIVTGTVVTRMDPKSASMAWGGSESVIRMFGWKRGNFTTGASVRVIWRSPV